MSGKKNCGFQVVQRKSCVCNRYQYIVSSVQVLYNILQVLFQSTEGSYWGVLRARLKESRDRAPTRRTIGEAPSYKPDPFGWYVCRGPVSNKTKKNGVKKVA